MAHIREPFFLLSLALLAFLKLLALLEFLEQLALLAITEYFLAAP